MLTSTDFDKRQKMAENEVKRTTVEEKDKYNIHLKCEL